MAKFLQSAEEIIFNTPLVKLNKLTSANDANVYAKIESSNPGGSVKDRIVVGMINAAEKGGSLKPGGTIVEPTSGNTGIGLALLGATRGYNVVLAMPESMSIERRALLTALGAEIVLTPAAKGMKGAIEKAEELLNENEGYFMPQQFDNPANPEIHRKTTGPEILEAMAGEQIDACVFGVGTGGTLTGTGEVIKAKFPNAKIYAVEPAKSPVLSGGSPGPHKIQGIGAGFVPSILNTELIDEVVQVEDVDA
ncbi:MAG: cysteine synthase A, partial [Nitrospinae bacterium]|nr:cysteine synthase A [Nitrospinota bacterium]